MAMNVAGILRMVVCVVALIFCILALALPSWNSTEVKATQSRAKQNSHAGLYKACRTTEDKTKCLPVSLGDAAPLLVQFMVVVGVVLLAGVFTCSVLHVTNMAENTGMVYSAGALAAAAGLLQLIAFSVYADYMSMLKANAADASPDTTIDYGAAFGLDIAACILSFVVASMFVVPQLREGAQN